MQTTTKTSQGATVTVRTSKNVMRAFTVTAIIDANAAPRPTCSLAAGNPPRTSSKACAARLPRPPLGGYG